MNDFPSITFVPDGGLANRMRSIAAAVRLSDQIGSVLEIIWFQDWGLKCDFEDLFMPIDKENILIRNASLKDKILYDRPRRRNFHLPVFFQKFMFDLRVGGGECLYTNVDFVKACANRKVWLSSFYYFITKEIPENALDIFSPQERVQKRIDQIAAKFGSHSIGVHIRRTDNEKSIRESPTSLFIERMKQEPDDTVFYLATDSNDEKQTLKNVFGEHRIITSDRQANRKSVKGMEDALTDMFLLAKTNRILGSYYSSFSHIASLVGKKQLEIIRKSK